MKRFVILIAVAGSACFSNEEPDSSAPVVLITSPTATDVHGSVTFSANVVDDFGVEEVEFFAGNVSLIKDRLPPYDVLWSTVSFPDGPIQLRVIARDYAGNTSQAAKTVNVDNSPN